MNFKFIYKICTKSELLDAKSKNQFKGSKNDLKDGYIHFSGEEQVKGTLKKFYSNQKLAGKQKAINFLITDGAIARVVCYELNKKFSELSGWKNKLEVILNSKEFSEFLYIYTTGNQ